MIAMDKNMIGATHGRREDDPYNGLVVGSPDLTLTNLLRDGCVADELELAMAVLHGHWQRLGFWDIFLPMLRFVTYMHHFFWKQWRYKKLGVAE
jgi:hypothetical protein